MCECVGEWKKKQTPPHTCGKGEHTHLLGWLAVRLNLHEGMANFTQMSPIPNLSKGLNSVSTRHKEMSLIPKKESCQDSHSKANKKTTTPHTHRTHTHTLTLTHTHTHSSALLPVETNTPLRCQVSLLPRRCWEERILRNTCPWRRMLRSCSRSACTKESSTANGKHMMSQSHSG